MSAKAEENKIQEIPLTTEQTEYLRACEEKIRAEEARFDGLKAGMTAAVSVYVAQILKQEKVPGYWGPTPDMTKLVEMKR